MTKDEAVKVIDILLKSDRGCSACAASAIALFTKHFSEYANLAQELFLKCYPKADKILVSNLELNWCDKCRERAFLNLYVISDKAPIILKCEDCGSLYYEYTYN